MATEQRASAEQNVQSQGKEGARGGQQTGLSRRADPFGFSLMPSATFLSPYSIMNPFIMLRRLTEDMDRAFGEVARDRRSDAIWAPVIEVTEREGNYVIRAELPGLKPEDVKVECTDEALVIEGERKLEREEDGGRRSERMYGRFSRVIPLPEGAKVTDAQARFQDGVLEVTIPVAKRDEKRRQIPIESGASANSAQQQGK